MRCFIAVKLPEHVRARFFHEMEILKSSGMVIGNFVEKDNLHLTLKFLGELTEEEISKVESALQEIEFKQFVAENSGLGFFPNENYIKVLWVGLKGDYFFDLHKIVEERMEKIGIKKDDREFSTHITLARIKNVKDKQGFLDKLQSLKFPKEVFTVDNISLIKSELTKNGPVYKTLKEVGFSVK